jgi:hypothetical protein
MNLFAQLLLSFVCNRSVVAIIGWIKFIFTTEQKKTDYKPEEDAPMQMISPVRTTLKIEFSVLDCIL